MVDPRLFLFLGVLSCKGYVCCLELKLGTCVECLVTEVGMITAARGWEHWAGDAKCASTLRVLAPSATRSLVFSSREMVSLVLV